MYKLSVTTTTYNPSSDVFIIFCLMFKSHAKRKVDENGRQAAFPDQN